MTRRVVCLTPYRQQTTDNKGNDGILRQSSVTGILDKRPMCYLQLSCDYINGHYDTTYISINMSVSIFIDT